MTSKNSEKSSLENSNYCPACGKETDNEVLCAGCQVIANKNSRGVSFETTSPEPRPNRNSPEILEDVIDIMKFEVFEWFQGAMSLDQLTVNLRETLTDKWMEDGYVLARRFEDITGGSDSDLVTLLDTVSGIHLAIYSMHIKFWVQRNNLKPKFKVGTKVYLNTQDSALANKVFEVFQVYGKTLTYAIKVEGENPSEDKAVELVVVEEEDLLSGFN
jgi:hypothetical protein